MDARIGRLIVEANEISQCLKKDYIFSTDKTGDSTNRYVQVMSKSLKIDSKISIPSFKDKLITLRKLMYEDPSDASLSRADEIVGKIHSADTKTHHSFVGHDDQVNDNVVIESQINLNNCSSSPSKKIATDNIPKRSLKHSDETNDPVEKGNNNYLTAPPVGRVAKETNSSDVSNGKISGTNFADIDESQEKWKPKEPPRKRSLQKFPALPEFVSNSKTSNHPVSREHVEEKQNVGRGLDPGVQVFLKVCGLATAAIEKNLQESQCESHFCMKGLQSVAELYEIITYFKKSQTEKLTPEFQLRCLQSVTNLRLLAFIIPHVLLPSSDDSTMLQSQNSESFGLMDLLRNVTSNFTDLWKAIYNGSLSTPPDFHSEIHKSLLRLVGQLGIVSVTSEYPCPLTSKTPSEISDEFMSGCDLATFQAMESSLTIINQCYGLLEAELVECKDADMEKMKSSLMLKVFSLVRSIKELLMIIKQIREELKATPSVMSLLGNSSENFYSHSINMLSASVKMSEHIESLTKSSLLLIPAVDITILTLKRVSKNVSQVEESSRTLSSSYIHGGMESFLAQDQLEAMSDVQNLIDTNCADLRNLLLDGISLGMNRPSAKADMSLSSTNLQSSFHSVSRSISKRVLPATPRGDAKQGNHPFISENRVFKHISQSPSTSNISRIFQDGGKHFSLDHSEGLSAFERMDNRSFRALEDEVNKSKLEMLEEEVGRGLSGSNAPIGSAAYRRKPSMARNQAYRHSFI